MSSSWFGLSYEYIHNLVGLFKVIMDIFRIMKDQNGDCENTSVFPQRGKIDSVSGLALLSLWSRNHARFGLQTVFSTTQSDLSIALLSDLLIVLELK
jgi:hypothetical protein